MATARFRRPRAATDDDPERRIAAVVTGHSAQLLRVARASSLCADDAQDALQRALEIYVRRLDTVEPTTEIAWLKVVVRHEAMAIRRARQDSVAGEEIDFDARAPSAQRDVQDHVEGSERVGRSAEALRALKPDERTALLLKAQGHSYEEIGARQGWTYTKTNRSITEGRRRFLKVYRGIEAGEECDRLAPALAALVGGTARAEQLLAVRPHLRHCSACRAAVRDLHPSWRGRVAAWLPLPALLAPLRWLHGAHDRGEPPSDALVRGAVDVAAAPVAPAAGDGFTQAGLRAVEHADQASRWRLGGLRAEAQQLAHRLLGSDVATGAQLSAGAGGGRGMGIAAILGVCLTGAGAGTYCAVTGTLPDPVGIVRQQGDADREERAERRAAAATRRRRAPRPPKTTTAYVISRPTPAPTATPARRPRRRPAARSAGRASGGTSTASPAPAAPSRPAKQEFGFEAAAGGSSQPAASAGGAAEAGDAGGEFGAPAPSGGGGSGGGGSGGSHGSGGGEFGFE